MSREISIPMLTSVLVIAGLASSAFAVGLEVTAGLNLENVTINPSHVYVGSSFTLSGTIRNIADRELDFVRITVQGGFPFSKTSPLDSFYVDRLMPSQTFQFSIPLTIDNDASNQQYSLQIAGQYAVYDSSVSKADNVIVSQALTATVKVDKGADLEIVNATFPQQIVPDMKNGLVVVYVQNKGINPAEQVQFNLAAEYPFLPTGKSYFVDEIQPGAVKPVTFHIDVDSSAALQNYPIDMNIKWKEGNNQYSDTKTFGILVSGSGIQSLWLLSGLFSISNFIILLLVAALVLVLLRNKKKAK